MPSVSSRDNPAFRQVLDLVTSSRERRRRRSSLIEGIHLCRAYRTRYGEPQVIVVTGEARSHPEVPPLLSATSSTVLELTESLFRELSQVENGIGIAYVISTPVAELPEQILDDCVYLHRLQDPGNVGALLRTCAAVGVRRVLTAPRTVFCWSPKVIRAGMGAHFALEIHEGVDWADVLPRLRLPVMATSTTAAQTIYDVDLRAPRLWLFGNEGAGLPADFESPPVAWLSIPQSPSVESLNVSVAGAVCLFEQLRQRRAKARVTG
jgi:RNA methyltransferase, TrmH family